MNTAKAYQYHNHQHCIEEALATAQQCCRQKGARLTRQRKQVLTLLWKNHKPLGAYEILDLLSNQVGTNKRLAPPTVYRALDFLQEQGLVHRIASLNAYIGCCQPQAHHDGQFYICQDCHCTAEFFDNPVATAISQCANQTGFQVKRQAVEVFGICPRCNNSQGNHTP
jgi:Fur family zinc uptake transcriptional regulator